MHVAAEKGNLDLARSLLNLGADTDIRDKRFNSTPLDWARYLRQEQLIELLESLTTQEELTPEELAADPGGPASPAPKP